METVGGHERGYGQRGAKGRANVGQEDGQSRPFKHTSEKLATSRNYMNNKLANLSSRSNDTTVSRNKMMYFRTTIYWV